MNLETLAELTQTATPGPLVKRDFDGEHYLVMAVGQHRGYVANCPSAADAALIVATDRDTILALVRVAQAAQDYLDHDRDTNALRATCTNLDETLASRGD